MLVCGDATMVEDIAVRYVLRGAGSGDVAVGLTEDVTVLKPCCRWAEDEVGSALNIAVLEVETCLGIACVDGILMAKEPAVDKRQLVTLCMKGYGLSQTCSVVLDGDVLQRDTTALNL